MMNLIGCFKKQGSLLLKIRAWILNIMGIIFFLVPLVSADLASDGLWLHVEFEGWATYQMNTESLGGAVYFNCTVLANSNADQWLLENSSYNNKWVNAVSHPLNSVLTLQWVTSGGSDNTISGNAISGNYYTIRMKQSSANYGYADSSAVVLRTTAFPVKILAVTDNSSGSVSMASPVRVRVVLSNSKSSEERIYVRYTTNSWTSDVFKLASMSNSTIYTCSIPALNKIGTVNYYLLTTTTNWALNNDLDLYPDLMTLRLNNNSGLNYSYNTVGIRTIDGNPSDWVGTALGITNSSVISSSEFIWKDAAADRRYTVSLGGNTNAYELEEFRMTSDTAYIYFLAKFRDLTNGYPYIGIGIDSDKVNLSGQEWFGDLASLKASSNARWEKEVIMPFSSMRFYTTSWTSTVAGSKAQNASLNCIEGAIAWSSLGLTNGKNYRFSIMVAQDSNGFVAGKYLTGALDVISPMPGETWSEVSDQMLDFWFDVSFNPAGGVDPNLNAPVASSAVSPVDIRVSDESPVFSWNSATDADSDEVPFYLFQLSASSNFSTSLEYVSCSGTNRKTSATLPYNTKLYWRVRPYDIHGQVGVWSMVSSFTTKKLFKTIDGQADDWKGSSAGHVNMGRVSSNEWIWVNKTGAQRTDADSGNLGNYNCEEARVTFDSNDIYFLFKYASINDVTKPYVAVTIRTQNSSSTPGMNWIADDSDILIGGKYGRVSAESHYPHFNVILHDAGVGTTQIELFTNTGNAWYAPPTYGSTPSYINPTTGMIEFKIARSDVGLVGTKKARFQFVFLKNSVPSTYANSGDSTYDYFLCDAVDAISIPPYGTNDPGNNLSKWVEEISDGAIDFWVELNLDPSGYIHSYPAPVVGPVYPTNDAPSIGLQPVLMWNNADGVTNPLTGYLLELSTTADLSNSVLYRVNVTNTNYAIPSSLPDGMDYFWRVRARTRAGELTPNAPVWHFSTIATQQIPLPTTAPFTPFIDGIKETAWGSNSYAVASAFKQPRDFSKDIYLSNDPDYLYLGFTMGEDYSNESATGYDKSSHFGFIFESKALPTGITSDPFIANNGTTVAWTLKPNFWAEGWLKSGVSSFGKFITYDWDNSTSSLIESSLVEGSDYKFITNSWAEFRIPLDTLDVDFGDKVSFFRYFRPSEDVLGISASLPFDASACNDFGSSASVINARILYKIQYAPIAARHIPEQEEVVGMGTMRSPLSPASSDRIDILVGVYPHDGYDSAEFFFTTNNWATSTVLGFEEFLRSANDIYLKATIGPFPSGKTVKYLSKLTRNGMTTYLAGNDLVSTSYSNLNLAQASAFSFVVGNSAPPQPAIILSPSLVYSNGLLLANISFVSDSDNQPLSCFVEWYKNGVHQTNLDSQLTNLPFQTSVTGLSPGDSWVCSARLFDGYLFSEKVNSSAASVLLTAWTELIDHPFDRLNRALFTNGEYVWFDAVGDVRSDQVPSDADVYDLEQFRIKADDQYLYFLIKTRDLSLPYRFGTVVTINTDLTVSSSKFNVGDEMSLALGTNYYGPASQRGSHLDLLLHSKLIGTPIIEMIRTTDTTWTALAGTEGELSLYPESGYCEARVQRSVLGLSGNKRARISVAIFKDYVGSADLVDSSIDMIGNDALDSASVGFSNGSSLVNYISDVSSWQEELSDNALDFWFDVPMTMTNSTPQTVSGFIPSDGAVLNTLTPALTWARSTEPDVTSYRLQLWFRTNELLYDVNTKSTQFVIPENLPYSFTNYYWRVYARDVSGQLSPDAPIIRFKADTSSPLCGKIIDSLNLDNMNKYSGSEDADGHLLFTWSPAVDASGVSNYYLCVGTTPNGIDILSDKLIHGSLTRSVVSNLAGGITYYAKVKAMNKLGIIGDYGESSDGIYVSKINIEALPSSEWSNSTPGNNVGTVVSGVGIWQDALGDVRNQRTNMDLYKFKVTSDANNLYLYLQFTSAFPWTPGNQLVQIALQNDSYSRTRVFQGRNISSADLNVSSDAAWEYLIKVYPGQEDVDICDDTFNNWRKGRSFTTAGEQCVVAAIPLSMLGGQERFSSSSVKFSIAIFSNNLGSVASIDGDFTPDALETVSSNTGDLATWNSISDQILDYYLSCSFDSLGNVISFYGQPVSQSTLPTYVTAGAGSAGWIQNSIIYFMFIDRFYNGDPANDVIGGTTRKGGDLKGILDNLDYLRSLNINTIYVAPPMAFGEAGSAGYNPYDWWKVDSHFGSEAEFREFISTLKANGIDLIIDWPGTAIGGGPVADNNPNWSKLYQSPWGGWPEWTVGMAEVQQFFSDTTTHWSAKGVRGFRMDYAKFDGNPLDHGHQYWQYVRKRLKSSFPDRYIFGEIFDGAYKISTYTWDGNELDGCFDFPLAFYGGPGINGWAFQNNTDSGSFWSGIQANENSYGNNPIMISFLDNHDKDRALRQCGGDSWKLRQALGFSITWHEPTSLFYGTEMGMDGWRIDNDLDNSPCIDLMWGINPLVTPEWGGYNFIQYNFTKRLLSGKRSFPGLRSGKIGVNVRYASGQWFIYERNYYNETALVIINQGSSGASAPCGTGAGDITTWPNRKWRDWMNGGDNFFTGADGKFTGGIFVNGHDTRVLISRNDGGGGYGECTIYGKVNVPNAIVRIKDFAGTIYERVAQADQNGNYSLQNVMTYDDGNENRTVECLAPGYSISYMPVTLYDTGNINLDISLSPDNTSPAFPKGLTARAGDGLVQLNWVKNTEDDFNSYVVYRSEDAGEKFVKIDESLDNAYIDNSVKNGTSYSYRIRAKDRSGNLSAYSKTADVRAGTIPVTFWIDMSTSGLNHVETVLIRGNSEKMNFWGIIGDDKQLEDMGNGLWKITFDLDSRMGVMYKFKVLANGSWYEENYFSGSGTWYGNRYVDLNDQGQGKLDLFHRWNNLSTPVPVRPDGLTLSPGNNQVSLAWEKNPEVNIQYYALYRKTAGSFSNIARIDASLNQFIDKDVLNGTAYFYYITAVNSLGQASINSKTNTATPQSNVNVPPTEPLGLLLSGYSTNQVYLSWMPNKEPNLAGYNVYRSNTGGSWARVNKTLVSIGTNPHFIDTVSPYIDYSYKVTAIDDSVNANESAFSVTVAGKLSLVRFIVDMGPISFNQVSLGGNALPFTWSGVRLSRLNPSTPNDNRYFVDTGLMAGQSYQYKYSYDGIFEEDFNTWHKNRQYDVDLLAEKEAIQIDVWGGQPKAPANCWTFPFDKRVALYWDAVSAPNIGGYNVYYSTNAAGPFVRVNSSPVTGTSYEVSGLQNNTRYFFKIRSFAGGVIRIESADSILLESTPRQSVPVYFKSMLETEPLWLGKGTMETGLEVCHE